MLAFVKRRGFLIVLGFLLLALFIWYAGPYFAFADYRPLDDPIARVMLFALIVALYVVWRVVKRLMAARATGEFAAAVAQQAEAGPARPSAEVLQLRERFEEAVATLKGPRRTGGSLYDLPWYVIIGAPGSGKTTALLNSGLKFPLEQRVGRGALKGVGGTRNCDWWFTDEAVFLDTAGRYTTQDSDAASDSAAWAEFLALLVKYRKRRPLNGIILTISAPDLMAQGEAGRHAHVDAARRRLNELNAQLRIQLPVYVMVTKCDLVAGFAEYFDDLTQETRKQVWGVTFAHEQTLKGEAAPLFPKEFDRLIARLNERVFARVEEDRDVRRRTKIFAFPQQVAALGGALSQFVGELFASTRLDRPALLRGVYFTSGTQEGTPIDRLLGAIARRYGVTAEAVPPPTGRGKAYFVERLLKEVLIGESGLAGVNQRLEMQKAALQLAAYAGMAVLAVCGVLLFSVSYSRNRAYIGETERLVGKIAEAPRAGPKDPVEALLPRLNAIRAVVAVADEHRDNTPWTMRWGLYQGNGLGNLVRDAYVREMDGNLLPRMAVRIEERLGQYASEPEKLYEYLKAYLMLGEPKRLDKDHLKAVAAIEWRPPDAAATQAGATLAQHFESLLDYAGTLRPIPLKARLVAQARASIGQASIPQIIYGRLKRTYQGDEARAVRLDQVGGLGVERVIRRRGGTSLSTPVPAFFTRAVFKEVTGTQIGDLVKQFVADDWVWGENSGFFKVSAKLTSDVTDLYERDYAATWDGVLNDIEIVPLSSSLSQAAEALGILSGPTSPLKALLQAIADNTMLVERPAAPSGIAGTAKKGLTDKLGGLLQKLPDAIRPATAMPGAFVTAQFQPVRDVLAGEAGSAPIDRLFVLVAQMQHYLNALAADPNRTPPGALLDPGYRELAQNLKEASATMPAFIQAIVAQVGTKTENTVGANASTELERRYQQEVLRPCSDVLKDRYPFVVTSAAEVPMSDFINVFGFGGYFDRFFAENVERLVDTSQPSWTWRPGPVAGSRDMLEKFQAARRIRDLFFRPGSPAPDIRFSINTGGIDPAIPLFVLEIDGRYYKSDDPRQPQQAGWPGPTPGRASARIAARDGAQTQDDALGAWGLFRLFDRHAQLITDTRFMLTFDVRGLEARVYIDADRVDNPFAKRDWQRFTCGQ